MRAIDSGSPVSVSNPSPRLAAALSLARCDSASSLVVNESLNLRPATTQRTR